MGASCSSTAKHHPEIEAAGSSNFPSRIPFYGFKSLMVGFLLKTSSFSQNLEISKNQDS